MFQVEIRAHKTALAKLEVYRTTTESQKVANEKAIMALAVEMDAERRLRVDAEAGQGSVKTHCLRPLRVPTAFRG